MHAAELTTESALRAQIARWPMAQIAAAGLSRDPGNYNLLVHLVPPEIGKDRAATAAVQARLQQPAGPIGLYLHIAPCTGRCTFCHYAIDVNPSDAQLQRYLQALQTDMALRWAQLPPDTVRSVLIGGGTPTFLTASQLDDLLGHLRRTVALPAGIEFTCEGAPETITAEKLRVLRDHGVNRFSLGIQAFDDGLLRMLGRRHDGNGARKALDLVQAAGFAHCNLDLIYALPGQSLATWLGDVGEACDRGIDSLTTYHLRKRPDTAISRNASPPADVGLLMHLGALELLQGRGYRQSLVDYFCKSGLPTAQVQARDKWRDMQAVDGCGAEAVSRRPDVVAFAPADPSDYAAAVEAGAPNGQLPISHGQLLTQAEQMAQRAMFALKVLDADGGLDLPLFAREFGVAAQEVFAKPIALLTDLGLLEHRGDRLHLTELGTLHADEACAQFWPEHLKRPMAARVQVDAHGAPVPNPRGTGRDAVQSANTVVIGAGIAGLAVAAQLASDLGAGLVVVEAESDVGQGATAASIGGFRLQSDDPVWSELVAGSLRHYEQMAQGPQGEKVGLKRSGYLFIAANEQDAALCQEQADIAARFGGAVQVLTPAQTAELVPGLRVDDLLGAYWGAGEGQLDPHGIASLWRRQVQAAGGQVRLGTRATGLRVSRGRVTGVHTTAGLIAADRVVIAAGPQTDAFLRANGVALPLSHGRRRVVLAEGAHLPRSGPLVLSRTPPLYFRAEAGGVLLSARELADEAAEDWLHVAADRAIWRYPVLQGARFRPAWSGVQTHSPDSRPLIGPCPGLDGAYLLAALGGAGIMQAPEVGRIAAAWLRGQDAGKLGALLDPRRFLAG